MDFLYSLLSSVFVDRDKNSLWRLVIEYLFVAYRRFIHFFSRGAKHPPTKIMGDLRLLLLRESVLRKFSHAS